MSRTVIFDFDGTLALGSGPVDAYVREIALLTDDAGIATAVRKFMVAFETGDAGFVDAYAVVKHVATTRRVDAATLDEAYHRSREALATVAAPIEAPRGLAAFLGALAGSADVMVATNSPATRMTEALQSLGIYEYLAAQHTSVGKPEGLAPIVAEALESGPVLSVGDIYVNDLAPASALGASTALIGPAWRENHDKVTMAALTLPELYASIQAWAGIADPAPSGASDSLQGEDAPRR